MSATKHTVGPWEVVGGGGPLQVIAPGKADICTMEGSFKHPGVIADANLIAAAPALLEALNECLGVIEGLEQKAGVWHVIGDKVRAAILKATGEAS